MSAWSDEVVEAVARELYLHDWDYPDWMPETGDLPAYVDQARAALAALEPFIKEREAEAWDRSAEATGGHIENGGELSLPNPYREGGDRG